jgi:hypothetical protein
MSGPEPTARARARNDRERWTEAEIAFNEVVLARPFDPDVLVSLVHDEHLAVDLL